MGKSATSAEWGEVHAERQEEGASWNDSALIRQSAANLAKTLESAHEEYDSEERAHRTAYSSLKHSFEKVGDHWEPKDEKGPSDERASHGRGGGGKSAGGVDVKGHSKRELYQRAKELEITGRTKMSKQELGRAIARAQD